MAAGTAAMTGQNRVFLFLQGPSSPIFAKIADRLEARGHRCLRINLNAGDRIFWRRRGGYNFRGRPADWESYLAAFLKRHAVTDLVLLGEERAYHQAALAMAKRETVDIYVVEMGYLRPDWLTLERDGMSSNSHFPADPGQIIAAGRDLPEPDWQRRHSQTFLAEATYDLLYNLPNVFLWFLYPHYRRHALFHPLAEYGGWLLRLAGEGRRKVAATVLVDRLAKGDTPFFVFPLQLQTDFQLRAHSPFNGQHQAIDEVLASFAAYAPAGTTLVVKVHPLDNGLIDWQAHIRKTADRHALGDRVSFLDGGDLNALLETCLGVVTINSTVGLHALQRGRPVKVLGTAIFNIDGLTDQVALDRFWATPALPDEALRTAFLRLLAASIQVRGNFYSAEGTDAGADAIAARLDAGTVNEPGAYVDPPPRGKPAKRRQST
ncbi:capsule biosynthesis protein [Pararhizobium antarcticum]|uniref:Capsular biosynthesis protein n=1 Tax=Pararhizobium antarcticum TaxID=1798805 RepID=A0A657LZF4_9HYPH|nr:capsular biosynthesis protein [Pararhizobium antarcticum]OJF98450.1 capsular biosynthesis protein [Rhizobium sp. 58]OJG01018.1 capsular biosynthesis protein [Pararhizobium antarcticum]